MEADMIAFAPANSSRTSHLFDRLHIVNDQEFRSAAINMAIDEALLETAKIPSIRFYHWASPALSFGYFGKFTDVAGHATKHDLVRRWTGGGIVFHGDDLTYSIVIPASDPAFAESSMSIYESVHRALADVLIATGDRAVVAAAEDRGAAVSDPACNGYCFANPVRADVMVDGRKIAGAAQRRTRRGLLQQGSVQHVDLTTGFAERFAKELCGNCSEKTVDDRLLDRAQEIAKEKYATQAWLRKR
jgi:lipoate-protein ligase A